MPAKSHPFHVKFFADVWGGASLGKGQAMMNMKTLLITNLMFFLLSASAAYADECDRIIVLQKNLQSYSNELIKLKSPNSKSKNLVADKVLAQNSLSLSILELVNLAESGSCGTTVTKEGSSALIIYGDKVSKKSSIHRDVLNMQNGEFSNSWKRYSTNSEETIFKF